MFQLTLQLRILSLKLDSQTEFRVFSYKGNNYFERLNRADFMHVTWTVTSSRTLTLTAGKEYITITFNRWVNKLYTNVFI